MYLKGFKNLQSNKFLAYLPIFVLGLVTIYSTWYANYYLSGNSDDIVYPYLFKHFKFHDILLPGQHSNILKFPIYIFQSIIPYDFRTFTAVNIILALITFLGWAFLLIWVFGKKYTTVICLVLISILLGSRLFGYDVTGTTIRNIEYPIVLLFVITSGNLLEKIRISRKRQIWAAIIGVLYSMTLAGDSFFLYTMTLSIFVTLVVYWFYNKKTALSKNFKYALYYVAGFTVLALLIRLAIDKLGIAIFYNASVFRPQVLPLNHLAPSLSTATTQLLNLFDANIFGQIIRPSNVLVFLNFGLLVIGVTGLIFALKDTLSVSYRKRLVGSMHYAKVFTIGVMALTFFTAFALYIGSGLVVVQNATGSISSAYQERYITIMPLLLVAGIAYLLWSRFDTRRVVMIILSMLIIVVLLISITPIKNNNTYQGAARQSIIDVSNTAHQNGVSLLVTGYWYGASTDFWSHGNIQDAVIASCNIPAPPFNNRISWYKPSNSVHKSALVIVRLGEDSLYWHCTNAQLMAIYGTPAKVIQINADDSPTLWIYNYDLRTKLTSFIY